MKSCPDEKFLQEWLDDSLAETERLILNEHLKQCSDCRKILNQLKIMAWDLAHLNVPAPSQDELDTVRIKAVQNLANEMAGSDAMSMRDLYQLTVGNLKYSSYHSNFIPLSRWVTAPAAARSISKARNYFNLRGKQQ